MDRWTRPAADQAGWTKAYSVWVPSEDVIDVPDDRQTSTKIHWFPVPDQGVMMGVHIVIVEPDLGEANLSDVVPVDAFALCDGRIVLLLASYHEPNAEERGVLDSHRARLADQVAPLNLSRNGHAYRSTIWAIRDETGDRVLYDLAVFPQTS